jgi:prevent-host-death family protein
MIQITTSQLKSNIARYIALVEKEDILITRNGKTVARLIGQKADKVAIAKSLFGILKGSDIDEKALKDERLARI